MNSHDGYALAAIVLLTLLNAFFTLAETALVTVRQARLQQMVAQGQDAEIAGSVRDLMRQPTRIVATVQVGITLAAFGAASLAAAVIAPDVAPSLERLGIVHPEHVAGVVITLLAALFTIAVGEIVPRSIGVRYPERAALAVAGPLRLCMIVFAPLAGVALGLSNALVRPFGLTAKFAAPLITEEELRAILEVGAQSGAIEEDEKQIIRNVISFGDTDVRQVMTPRVDIKAADITIDLPALLSVIVDSGHSRIPVYEGSVDAIAGIVYAKDLLPALARGEHALDLRKIMRPPLFVSENKRVDELLDQFRRSRVQLAVVQDEYGGTAGLVSIEDLLEEIVGEIRDEYDVEAPPEAVIAPDASLVDARTSLIDLNERMGLALPLEDYDTVGGFVFGLLGREPVEGDSVFYDDVEFIVEKTEGRQAQEIRLLRRSGGDAAPSEAPGARNVLETES